MGGRALFATVSALTLLLSSIGGAATVLAGDACVGDGLAALPPGESYAGADAIVIGVTWAKADAAGLQYIVTDSAKPVKEPFAGTNDAYLDAGCAAEAIICGPVAPLILTTAFSGGRNQGSLAAGHYTIVAAPGGACVYHSGEGGKAEYATAPATIPVTATIEYYRSGETTPSVSKSLESVMVPTLEEPPVDLSPHRRILGSFDWDPVTGVTNIVAAEAPAGTDGVQTAEGPPAPDPAPEGLEATGSAELEPVPEPEPTPERAWVPESANARLMEFLGWGRAIPHPDDPRLSDAQRQQVRAMWDSHGSPEYAQRVREWRHAEAARELAAMAEEEWWEEQILPDIPPLDEDPLTPEGLEATGSAELEPVPEPEPGPGQWQIVADPTTPADAPGLTDTQRQIAQWRDTMLEHGGLTPIERSRVVQEVERRWQAEVEAEIEADLQRLEEQWLEEQDEPASD